MSALATESVELRERGGAIPSARLLPLLDRYAKTGATPSDSLDRRIYKVRHETIYVSFDFTDRLLIDMGLDGEWHGELGDLYESEAQGWIGHPGPPRRIPREKVNAAYVLYRAGMTLPELGEKLYRRYGYASAGSCRDSLERGFRLFGYQIRTRSEAMRVRLSEEVCKGCGCNLDERQRGCLTCAKRHHWRREHGVVLPFVEAGCKACGCHRDERTIGCRSCQSRHRTRRQRGLPHIATRPDWRRHQPRRAPVEASPPCSSGGTHLSERSTA